MNSDWSRNLKPEQWPEFFSPVYKEVNKQKCYTITLKEGGDINLIISPEKVTADFGGGAADTIIDVDEFRSLISNVTVNEWEVKPTMLDIGCRKGVKVSDLEEVLKIYDEMTGK